MTKLNEFDIKRISAQLVRRCPDLEFEIKALAAQARGDVKVQYVEVTHRDGTKEVMRADEYHRLTATDLAHSNLRVLSDRETAHLRG